LSAQHNREVANDDLLVRDEQEISMDSITNDEIGDLCEQLLGRRPSAEPAFETTGFLSRVVGRRLPPAGPGQDDEIVVFKIRPDEERIDGCARVQRRLHAQGFPVANVLGGPVRRQGQVITIESYVPGGRIITSGPGLARRYADLYLRVAAAAPSPEMAAGLDPAPGWIRYDLVDWDDRALRWPPRDDDGGDLNTAQLPRELEDVMRRACERLQADTSPRQVRHLDLQPQNVRWTPDGRLLVVHDCDSFGLATEGVSVGLAAEHYTCAGRPLTEPTLKQSDAFLREYQDLARRTPAYEHLQLTGEQYRTSFLAGLFLRGYQVARRLADAQSDLADVPEHQRESRIQYAAKATDLLRRLMDEKDERFRRAAA
jgi:hypothetical protein